MALLWATIFHRQTTARHSARLTESCLPKKPRKQLSKIVCSVFLENLVPLSEMAEMGQNVRSRSRNDMML